MAVLLHELGRLYAQVVRRSVGNADNEAAVQAERYKGRASYCPTYQSTGRGHSVWRELEPQEPSVVRSISTGVVQRRHRSSLWLSP